MTQSPGGRRMGFSGGCRGSSGRRGQGRWEGAQQRQPPPSDPRPPGGLDPVLTLGRGSWVSVAGASCFLQELSSPWSSPGTLLVGPRVTPRNWMGTGCHLWKSQTLHPRARLGLDQPRQGICKVLVSAKRMRQSRGGLRLHQVLHVQGDATLRPFVGPARGV